MPCLEAELNYLRVFLFGCLSVLSLQAFATAHFDDVQGDPARGKLLNETCITCHGENGKALAPAYPNLGGQHEVYLRESLIEYKKGPEGARNNPIMLGMVATLSEQDMADLAAYYAAQEATVGEADPALVDRGEKIYRGGLVGENVPACSGCHGPSGMGNRFAGFPKLSGQNADYIYSQLMAFRSGNRTGLDDDPTMNQIATHMSDDDMAAVASYIQGLH